MSSFLSWRNKYANRTFKHLCPLQTGISTQCGNVVTKFCDFCTMIIVAGRRKGGDQATVMPLRPQLVTRIP